MAPAAQQFSSISAKASCELGSALHVKYHSVKSSGASSRTLERFDGKMFLKNRACGAAASALPSCELRLALKCEIRPGKETEGTITNQIPPVFIDSVISKCKISRLRRSSIVTNRIVKLMIGTSVRTYM